MCNHRGISGVVARRIPFAVLVVSVIVVTVATNCTRPDADDRDRAERPSTSSWAPTIMPAPDRRLRLMLVGDSIAYYLAEAFGAPEPALGFDVANHAPPGCYLLVPEEVRTLDGNVLEDFRTAPCIAHDADDVSHFDPDVVLLTLTGQTFVDLRVDGAWLHPCDPVHDEVFRAALRSWVADLVLHGARVALLTSVPPEPEHASEVTRTRVRCANDFYRRFAEENSETVTLVDFATWLCGTELACPRVVYGITLRPDGFHFVDDSALLVATWLGPQLRRIAEAR